MPRRIIHIIVSAQVTRVVVRNLSPSLASTWHLSAAEQRLDILRVMHHLVVAAELGVLVEQGIVAVGALRHGSP